MSGVLISSNKCKKSIPWLTNHLLPPSHTRILGTLSSSPTKCTEKASVYVSRGRRVFQAPMPVSSSRRETARVWAKLR